MKNQRLVSPSTCAWTDSLGKFLFFYDLCRKNKQGFLVFMFLVVKMHLVCIKLETLMGSSSISQATICVKPYKRQILWL